METDGADLGRFTDTDSLGFGQFANGIGQALAILALDRTAGGVPSEAVDYLLDQQCSDGSFRLYQFGYVLSFGPPPVTVTTHSCEDPAEGDADATAFALQALLAVPSSTAVSDAVSGAVAFLLGQQQGSGGFFGTGAVNSNTTGLAAAALRAAGEDDAADAGAAFLAALQSDACDEFGAIAYDQSAFDAGIAADRGQWTRASAQGALGLGLPAYGDIGTVAPVSAGLEEVACPAVVVEPGATASAASVIAGGSVTISGVGFAPGETVDATLSSTPVALGSFTADAAGTVEAPVVIPAYIEPGMHTVTLVGQTSGVEASRRDRGRRAGPRAGRRGGAAADRLGRRRAHADRDGAPRRRRRPPCGEPSPARVWSRRPDDEPDPARGPRPRGRARRAGFGARAVGGVARAGPGGPRRRVHRRRRGSPSSSTSPRSATASWCAVRPNPCDRASTPSRRRASPSQGTTQFPGLLCRINGEPASDPCHGAPPPDAYWGYWHAPRGGSWTYSSSGAGSRVPPAGSVEGWSFGDRDEPGIGAARAGADPDDSSAPRPPPRRDRSAGPATATPTTADAQGGGAGATSTTAPGRRDEHHERTCLVGPRCRGRRRRW